MRVLTETVRLSRVTAEQVAGIFLVGGASQIPLVATELHRAFGRPPVTIEQPEMVVAEGSVLVGARVDKAVGCGRARAPSASGRCTGQRATRRAARWCAGGWWPGRHRRKCCGSGVRRARLPGVWRRCVPIPCPGSPRRFLRRLSRRLGHRCRRPAGSLRSPVRGRRCRRVPCRSARCRSALRHRYTGCRRDCRIRHHIRSTTSRPRRRWSSCRNTSCHPCPAAAPARAGCDPLARGLPEAVRGAHVHPDRRDHPCAGRLQDQPEHRLLTRIWPWEVLLYSALISLGLAVLLHARRPAVAPRQQRPRAGIRWRCACSSPPVGPYAAWGWGQPAWLGLSAVYLGSALLLLLPSARAWIRPLRPAARHPRQSATRPEAPRHEKSRTPPPRLRGMPTPGIRLGVDFGTSNTVAVRALAGRAGPAAAVRRLAAAALRGLRRARRARSSSAATPCTAPGSTRRASSPTRSAASTTARSCSATGRSRSTTLIAAVLRRVAPRRGGAPVGDGRPPVTADLPGGVGRHPAAALLADAAAAAGLGGAARWSPSPSPPPRYFARCSARDVPIGSVRRGVRLRRAAPSTPAWWPAPPGGLRGARRRRPRRHGRHRRRRRDRGAHRRAPAERTRRVGAAGRARRPSRTGAARRLLWDDVRVAKERLSRTSRRRPVPCRCSTPTCTSPARSWRGSRGRCWSRRSAVTQGRHALGRLATASSPACSWSAGPAGCRWSRRCCTGRSASRRW